MSSRKRAWRRLTSTKSETVFLSFSFKLKISRVASLTRRSSPAFIVSSSPVREAKVRLSS